MFVLHPDPYLLPNYLISPFTTTDVVFNHHLPDSDIIDAYLERRFIHRNFCYTLNGRHALQLAFSAFKLEKDDVVTIFTTSGNFYISSCVTGEIEKFCKWSRQIENKSRVILLNHEFGFPMEDMEQIKSYNLPIIEDCAHSFFSRDKLNLIGTIGEYVVYSFPKMFPIQIGGLLVHKEDLNPGPDPGLDNTILRYIKNVLSFHIPKEEAIIDKRIKNYRLLADKFSRFGFSEKFTLEAGYVPGVFMFSVEDDSLDLDAIKEHFYAHGIQSSVFYGERAFFIPCHQRLEESDLEYFFEVMNDCLNPSAPPVRNISPENQGSF